MKRLFQALAIVQLALVVALGLRVVEVMRTEPPQFGEIPDAPAPAPIPPPKPRARISPAVTEAVVKGDLFDAQRGAGLGDINIDDAPVDATPLPPPTSVTLTGVMIIGAEPVAILSDPAVGPEQQSLRKGEMLGDYEVGEITSSSVTLLGQAGQQFHVPLKIQGGSGGGGVAAAPPAPGARPSAAANRPGTTAAARPATPRPGRGEPEPQDETRSMTARERAQAIAQRNAAARGRTAGNQQGGKGGGEKEEAGGADPVQARLDALRRLREAAKSR
ncbi:MAG TPA: hypothetical protein VEC57_02905 [Candidatus Limnocylindrales bacterium]|nr:hypothetical protein [Candidatus Limnocylindrales bacterium]